jgi:hypothetical protein
MRRNDLNYPRQTYDACCELPTDLVRPRPMDPSGVDGPTRHQAAGPHFRQTSAGLYVPAGVDSTVVEQRILEQGSRIRRHGAVTGWAALRWRGAKYFDGQDAAGRLLPVPLVVGLAKLRCDPRVALSQAQIAPTEYTWVEGIPVATVQRALFDEMCHARGVRQAVVVLEKATAAAMISVSLMARYVIERAGWTGVQQVRDALALACNGSRSPQETLLRLVWILDAALAMPLCNVPVFSLDGELLGYPDLLDVEAGMVGEYDGVEHKDGARHRKDVAREQKFRDHGLEYFAAVGGDLTDREMVVRRIHSTRSRALFLPPEKRVWTLEPPSWWVPEEDLDHYLLRVGLAPMLVRT